MPRGSLRRLKCVVVMGLLLSLSANGCMVAQPRKAPVLTTIEVAARTNAAIIQFYRWLRRTRQLLQQVPRPPNNPRPQPRQVDPKTLKPYPKPERTLMEKFDDLMKDLPYWDQFASGEMV